MKLNSISFGIFRGSSELPALLLNRLFYGHETWHIIGTHHRNKLKKCLFFSIMAHIFLLTSSENQNVPQFLQKYLSSFKLTLREQQKKLYHSVLIFWKSHLIIINIYNGYLVFTFTKVLIKR